VSSHDLEFSTDNKHHHNHSEQQIGGRSKYSSQKDIMVNATSSSNLIRMCMTSQMQSIALSKSLKTSSDSENQS